MDDMGFVWELYCFLLLVILILKAVRRIRIWIRNILASPWSGSAKICGLLDPDPQKYEDPRIRIQGAKYKQQQKMHTKIFCSENPILIVEKIRLKISWSLNGSSSFRIFEDHTLKALNIAFKRVVLLGRVKNGGTEGEIVVAHGCRKRKKLICGPEVEIVVAHGRLPSPARWTW